jgi:SAM-dependent methyltransferase
MPDIFALRGFYHTALGQAVKMRLWSLLRPYFTDTNDQTIIGAGYCTPYLRQIMQMHPTQEAPYHASIIALMPARQGAMYWPITGDNIACLSEAENWPMRDNSAQTILMIHMLEYEAYPADCLREAWRVLVPGGTLIFTSLRPHSLWRIMGDTPFAQGKCDTISTLKSALRHARFTWVKTQPICCAPPLKHERLARIWPWLDKIFCMLFPMAARIVIITAEKQIYASVRATEKAKKRVKIGQAISAPSARQRHPSGS